MIKITPTITLELDDNIADGQYTTLKADFFNNISLIELLKSIEAKYDSSTEDEYFIYCNLTTYLQVAARWLKTINQKLKSILIVLWICITVLLTVVLLRSVPVLFFLWLLIPVFI